MKLKDAVIEFVQVGFWTVNELIDYGALLPVLVNINNSVSSRNNLCPIIKKIKEISTEIYSSSDDLFEQHQHWIKICKGERFL